MQNEKHKWEVVAEDYLFDILECSVCKLKIPENLINEYSSICSPNATYLCFKLKRDYYEQHP